VAEGDAIYSESRQRTGRGRYRIRLANYAFWCRAGARLLQRTIGLAARRIGRTAPLLRSLSTSEKEYLVGPCPEYREYREYREYFR
jgi:hypothetical protein